MAGALTPKQRAIVEATDKALDEFGKQIVAIWFQSGTDRSAAMAGAVNDDGLKWLRTPMTNPNDPRWYQRFKYEEAHIPTEKLGVPTAPPQRCECGSGSNEASGAHSHWCPRWVRP